MDKREELKQGLHELIKEALELASLANEAKASSNIFEFGTKYQHWYTSALKIVGVLANDRLQEFIGYYKIDPKRKEGNAQNYVIQDFIMGVGARTDLYKEPLWDTNNVTAVKVYNQLQILESLRTRIDSVFADVQGSLLSELQDKELGTAEELLKVNLRAAGSLAGVILENHLQKVVRNHGIPITKSNPKITDLNDQLKKNGVYDLATWRNIQLLYDIRTKCVHKKEQEPTESEVRKLVSGVNEVIKQIF